jgi:hypothetical protein
MSTEENKSILTHKNFGRLLFVATLAYMSYMAYGDPGVRMMFGQTINTAELIKDQIANLQGSKERLEVADSIPQDWRIQFKTQSPAPKGTIVAFVDPMCVNCRTLIAKTGEINKMGYSIDYIVAPLPGDDRVIAADAVTCAARGDQQIALLNVAGDKSWSVAPDGCSHSARYNKIDNEILSKWDIKSRPYIITPDGVGIQGDLNISTMNKVLNSKQPDGEKN